ncbi:UNKNOWN [Stylonychia lemnae]|uniref:Transmembrane protein n=1 Tax=Stylonychia lemnae TaxID=5949 RepID=A0A078B3S8_STYLE|nr:UNKNOWN [Stylonychia lemnae]|eukprot:CDW88163.1 UNKNOWN [Stylonychia lemnae]
MDVFGIPVSLTYKGDPHLKSFPGGLATLLVRAGVFIYFLMQLIQVWQKSTTIQASQYRLDLSKDSRQYNLTDKDFDFAYKLEYIFFQQEPEVYPWVMNAAGRSVQQKIRVKQDIEICKFGRLGLEPNTIDYLNVVKNYYCPKEINFQLQGSYSAQSIKQIQLQVTYCNQTNLDLKYNKTKQLKMKQICKTLGF